MAFGQGAADQKGLRDYYQNYFPIGVAVTSGQLRDSVQKNFILKHFNNTIKLYASLGLKVQVTELDVSIYTDGNIPEQAGSAAVFAFTPDCEQRQAAQYKAFFKVFTSYKKDISGVTFWNLSDRYSWLDNFPVRDRKNYPLLFDAALQPKKAYWGVINF